MSLNNNTITKKQTNKSVAETAKKMLSSSAPLAMNECGDSKPNRVNSSLKF